MTVDAKADELVRTVMRRFLASPTIGCSFANGHAKEDSRYIDWTVVPDVAADIRVAAVDGFFDTCAHGGTTGIMVFPSFRSEGDVVALLRALAGGHRWTVSLPPWRAHARADVLVGVRWRTPSDRFTSMMGLGPLGSMPVHRRSPYFALLGWPGDHANPHRGEIKRADEVSLIDMPPPPGTGGKKYQRMWAESVARTEALRAYPPEGAARPNVAFCLPASCRPALEQLAGVATPR